MARDCPSGAHGIPFPDKFLSLFLAITIGDQDKGLYDDLRKLCERIEGLSQREFLLHPSKCRCLLQSYRVLLHPHYFRDEIVIRLAKVNPEPPSDGPLIRSLLHTLQEGERFLQKCTFQPGWMDLMVPVSRQWVINNALPIVLSTEIVDVHLHDFVVCIFALVRRMVRRVSKSLSAQSKLQALENRLQEIWASADDEGDTRRMRKLFTNFKSKKLQDICKLICRRLSEGTSKAQLNLADAIVPTYLWMDPPGFDSEIKKIPEMLSNHRSEVVVIKSMGGTFACKHFQGLASEEELTNEAVIQASLRHANVIHLLWCTRRAESHSLVMELMDENLGQVIERRRLAGIDPPFSLLAGIDVMLQIAKGMEYLHDLGIIHRDLKSFNILVRHSQATDNRDHLNVKVADFGSSKVKHNTSLFTTKLVGTSIWRAPEVVDIEDERKYTRKADVYSFGIVCSEILTGLPASELLPCERMKELHRVLKEGRRPQLPSTCPRAIADYIKKCWDGDASKRPTFKQICRVFRCFKACLLSGETDVLASSLPHTFDCERISSQAAKVERTLQCRFYHPVLGVPSELESIVCMAQADHFVTFDTP